MQVSVSRAPVGEAVDKPRIAVVREDHRPVGREDRIEVPVPHAVRVLLGRLQSHQVDHIDHAYPQLRQVLPQQLGGG
jgi:hypothetical protein